MDAYGINNAAHDVRKTPYNKFGGKSIKELREFVLPIIDAIGKIVPQLPKDLI
jgi:hypothetical protein